MLLTYTLEQEGWELGFGESSYNVCLSLGLGCRPVTTDLCHGGGREKITCKIVLRAMVKVP
jgi:hypothetical protein